MIRLAAGIYWCIENGYGDIVFWTLAAVCIGFFIWLMEPPVTGTIEYQFQVDGRAGDNPPRKTWKEAAQDCVNAGYGHFALDRQGVLVLKLASEAGAEIKRIKR